MTRERSAHGTTRRALVASIRGSFVTRVVGLPLTVLVIPVTLTSVSIQDFGTWIALSAVLGVLVLGEAGVGAEVTRRIARAHGADDAEAVRRAAAEGSTLLGMFGLVLLAVGVALTGPVFSFTFGELSHPERDLLRLVWWGVLLQTAIGLMLSGHFALLAGLQRTDFGAYLGVFTKALSLGLIFVFGREGLGVLALFLANLITTVASWVVLYLSVLRLQPGAHLRLVRPTPARLKPYFALTLVIVVANVSNIVDYQFDKIILTRLEGPSSAALYQIGTTLSLAALGLALAPIGLLLAGTAELADQDPSRLLRLQGLMTTGTYGLGAVLLLGTAVFGPPLLPYWLGNGYDGAREATSLLCLALVANLISAPWYYYAIGRNWLREVSCSAAANAIVNATASYALTVQLGLRGALLGSLIGNFAGGLTFYLVLRHRERRRWLRPVLRPFAIVVPLALMAHLALRNADLGLVSLLAAATTWGAGVSLLLLLAGALPFVLTRARGARLPRLVLPRPGDQADSGQGPPLARQVGS